MNFPHARDGACCARAPHPRLRAVVRHHGTSRARRARLTFPAENRLAGAMGRRRKGSSLAQHHRAPDRGAGRVGSRRRDVAGEESDAARRHRLGGNRRHGVLAVSETLVPTHTDGADRNDNKYIDNGPTFHQVNAVTLDRGGIRRQLSRCHPRRHARADRGVADSGQGAARALRHSARAGLRA